MGNCAPWAGCYSAHRHYRSNRAPGSGLPAGLRPSVSKPSARPVSLGANRVAHMRRTTTARAHRRVPLGRGHQGDPRCRIPRPPEQRRNLWNSATPVSTSNGPPTGSYITRNRSPSTTQPDTSAQPRSTPSSRECQGSAEVAVKHQPSDKRQASAALIHTGRVRRQGLEPRTR